MLLLHWPRVAGGQETPGRSHASALCASTVERMRKRALIRTMGKGKEYDFACTMAGFRPVDRIEGVRHGENEAGSKQQLTSLCLNS